MTMIEKQLTRAGLLKAGAASSLGLYLAGCGSSSKSSSPTTTAASGSKKARTVNMLTWSDHYANDQLAAVKNSTGIRGRPQLFSDNADAYLKIKQTGSQFDIVSGDALWVTKYNKDGLTESFDLASIPSSSQLYSIARTFPFWKDGSNYMGYPFSWSTVQIYYNPKFVKTVPDSWHALLDPKYKGKISLENIPTDMMAIAGKATGGKKPYSMTTDEIANAKDFLKQFKPNVLKLASQNNEVVRALADESAWIGITNLGTDDRVKDAGGPTVKPSYPKEGTVGFIDSEQIVKASKNKDAFFQFENAMQQADWIAKNFLTNGRPLFNEKAYKLLVDQGHGDRAKRLLYNQPEKALQMTIKGPAGNEQAYTDAFNEVFGA
ncbi:MAG: spermidine/putrescine transport system substrate-binding protein [Gaiellaceae bacterium]|nr:spermidine/putrescine transport system substrate-binding protein [Gaiellaceae bacterium]